MAHRNIKPENILIDKKGDSRLSDMAIDRKSNKQSKLFPDNPKNERYQSPELKCGEDQSYQSDIWSFGVVLLELSFGREELKNSEIFELDSDKVKEKYMIKGGYSSDLIILISKCFERDSKKRITARELLKDDWFIQRNSYISKATKPLTPEASSTIVLPRLVNSGKNNLIE